MRARRAFLALAASAALLPVPAAAHPFGQRPVATIRQVAAGVEIAWTVAEDDAGVLAARAGLGPYKPEVAFRDPSFAPYFFARLEVRDGARACPGAILAANPSTAGYTIRSVFDCGAAPPRARVRLTLLQDIDENYVTVFQVLTAGDPLRGSFVVGAPEFEFDFAGATPPSPAASPGPQAHGRSARIVGMLQGSAGAISLGAALGLALLLGALHAATPGHGKTITAAYLVGAGGTTRQALALGGIVAATHAVSIALLGLLALNVDLLVPGRIAPWLELAAGLLIVALGATMARARRTHTHDHAADPDLPGAPIAPPVGRLALIGVVGGLVPSPEAIAVVLVAFSLDRWAAGFALVLAFSIGLSAVVLAVAVAAVRGSSLLRRFADARWTNLAPRVAAAVFLAMGVAVSLNALRRIAT